MRIDADDIALLLSLPGLKGIVSNELSLASVRALSVMERRCLIDAVLGEFARIGLKSDDEPNEIGLRLEHIVDELSDGVWDEGM